MDVLEALEELRSIAEAIIDTGRHLERLDVSGPEELIERLEDIVAELRALVREINAVAAEI